MLDFVLYALIGGVGLAAFMGPLGVFVVWRRMAYFGDTLAHSALLGVVLGFALGIDLTLGIVGVCVTVAVLLSALRRRRQLPEDTLLGILSHSALALGLVALSFLAALRVDLMGYLFGDILAIAPADLYWIYGGGAVAMAALWWLWRPLLAVTVHEDLARVEGVEVGRTQIAFTVLIALIIALAMKIVGIILVTSLLIIPAATARRFSTTPEQMAAFASLLGAAAVVGGLAASLRWDVPAGPGIVVSAAALFALSFLWSSVSALRKRQFG